MNKTAIKNFAVWARRKLISEITYKASLIGISEKGILDPLSTSTDNIQFFDIGTGKPTEIVDAEIKQRDALIKRIKEKESTSDYQTAFQFVIEEVAYTWFNRLIAIRFMEVNDYLPSGIRVLSSETAGKAEPDMVTTPFDTDMEFSAYEKDRILQLKDENKLDELFRMLFIKQCNKLNEVLPALFEKTADYTELLLTISFTDSDGIVSHLIHDIEEVDFKEAVEIIGWLYQYYNTEPKDEVFALLKKNVKITKERIPAATQLFTPNWIVRYMVENSLGRLWMEGHPNEGLKSEWKYYLEEAEQEESVKAELEKIRAEYKKLSPEDIKVIDPCMGSGHILVYAFDVLMQIYESQGYTQRDAAVAIIENNLYGLDIDDRAYQLAYFAIMMKARKYDRRFLTRGIVPKLYSIKESNDINKEHLQFFGQSLDELERNTAIQQLEYLIDTFQDAKEYGSILNVENCDWKILSSYLNDLNLDGQITFESFLAEQSQLKLKELIFLAQTMAQQYEVVVTNPPYMKADNMPKMLSEYITNYDVSAKYDMFSIFILKAKQMLKKYGYVSMITMHNFMFSPSFLELRNIIQKWNFVNMLHLGSRAFSEISGEVVQTVSFVFWNTDFTQDSIIIDVTDVKNAEEKEAAFFIRKQNPYIFNTKSLDLLPGKAFGYSLSKVILELYKSEQFLKKYGDAKAGIVTGDDDYFVRHWYEISFNEICFNPQALKKYKYVLFSKGGTFFKWYGNNEFVLKLNDLWDDKKTNKSVRRGDINYYYKRCIGWSQMGGGVNKSYSEITKSVCKTTTPTFYTDDKYFNYCLGFLNSKIPVQILKSLNPTLSILVSDILNLPLVYSDDYVSDVNNLVNSSYEIAKQMYKLNENSWQFYNHPLVKETTIKSAFENWEKECNERFSNLKEYEEELNRIFIEIYGLQDELTPEVEDKDVTVRKADLQRDVKSFVSYAVGCMFGRYSLDVDGLAYAGGEWDLSKYQSFIPDADNCIPITDEEYFEDDIVGRFVAFVKTVYGEETLEENLDFIAQALGNKGDTSREIIRNYFIKDFYKDHVKIYQKRPIYWLYDSGKQNGFKALVYMHRYTADTTGVVRVDYLHKMQKIYMSEIDRMKDMAENSQNGREVAQAEKRKEKLIKQLKETKEYDELVAHLALSRIAIDLDDGVKVNYEKVQTGQDGKKLDILGKI